MHPPCNCRRKEECPLNGDCRKKAIVYKASISTDSNDPPKSYYGCCETEFKSRFYNHRQTFKNKQKRYTTCSEITQNTTNLGFNQLRNVVT